MTGRKDHNTERMRGTSLAELRQMLLTRRRELLATIRRQRGGLQEGAVERGEDALGDLADRPSLTPEAEIAYEVVDHRAHTLAQIDLALKKLDHGTYGLCDMCEEPIPAARLRALPFAVRCTRCQEEWERRTDVTARYANAYARD